jgi:hypothetical protein
LIHRGSAARIRPKREVDPRPIQALAQAVKKCDNLDHGRFCPIGISLWLVSSLFYTTARFLPLFGEGIES